MSSVVRTPSSKQRRYSSRDKFRTALGLGTLSKDPDVIVSRSQSHSRGPHTRQSIDAPGSRSTRRKHRKDRSKDVRDVSFVQPANDHPDLNLGIERPESFVVIDSTDPMEAVPNQPRRPPVRMDAQDGPWSVSVAETPHDARSYSLYIKTPTHNLTLTRTASEIVELHQKLLDSQPGSKLPDLPIDASALPPPTKRKSTFLNTLSRLASPSANRTTRHSSGRHSRNNSSAIPSTLPTPLMSPSHEIGDPFVETAGVNAPLSNNVTITGLASYLTTISNTPAFRQARVWKRFVRVRTDDLQSVRVERAIKRVRSDLAAHVSPKTPTGDVPNAITAQENDVGSLRESLNSTGLGKDLESSQSVLEDEIVEEEEDGIATADGHGVRRNGLVSQDAVSLRSTKVDGETTAATVTDSPTAMNGIDDNSSVLSTHLSSDHSTTATGRIHRSHSADPDKSSRLSRAYTSTSTLDPASSQTGEQTGDESSASTTGNRRTTRKKRSGSSDPSSKKKSQRKVVIDDFEMMRVLGKGCAGKVLLVRHKSTTDLYALKAITKRHVLAHQELQHTLTEQAVLKRMAAESKDPFVVKLWWSFHDKENLFLVMDFHPGGDLATQLARWGRLGRDRARFYAAEIVEGVEGLHAAGVIYRDLKPENILIGADGHIVLTDFGLSKEFPRSSAITAPSTSSGDFYSSVPGTPQPATPPWLKSERGQELANGWPGQVAGQGDQTSTFCGTAEYLAPEVIQGLNYSYEVDWWSFGTMLYEMLTGITPFWANNHSDMYVRVLQDELQFPDDRAIDQDTKSLIRGLLQRNPALRMCEPRIKKHPYFSMIDWSHVYYKRYIPPYIPPIDPSNASDTQNFDDTFLDMEPVIDDGNDADHTDTDQERGEHTDTDRTDGEETNTTPSQSRSSSVHPNREDDSVDVFDGYSFKGRHSVIIDFEEEEEASGEDEEDEEDIISGRDVVLEPTQDGLTPTEGRNQEAPEPKTPEARSPSLPELASGTDISPAETPILEDILPLLPDVSTPRQEEEPHKELEPPYEKPPAPEPPESKLAKPPAPPPKTTGLRPSAARTSHGRREKSGVAALDRYLSDTIDEDGGATEREDEDDDWDFIEAGDGEDRNGAKGTTLFARGVVDRYRLAVFGKATTPSQRSTPRSFSGTSKDSDSGAVEVTESPSPSGKLRRGRNPGLNFRKHPRQFLRPKSPPSTYSSKSSGKTTVNPSASNILSVSTASSPGLLTPAPSLGGTLKSKMSTTSVGYSSDQSVNGDADNAANAETVKGAPAVLSDGPEKPKNKKLVKKYKEGAEKMFSLFASPRQS